MKYNKNKYLKKAGIYVKICLTILCISITSVSYSQNIGINVSGSTPSVNAILDLNTGNTINLGLIVPNVSLNTTLTVFGMANAATNKDVGMMVYNTNTLAGVGVGYYYWNGTSWVSVTGLTSGGTGNITSCGGSIQNYIPYFTSSTNLCNSNIYEGSSTTVGIGTTSPQNMLDVNGSEAIGTSYAGSDATAVNNLIVQGDVGIGRAIPNTSAQLDVTSSSLGFLMPRMASAPASPATSLLYYNTTTGCIMYYTGSAWQSLFCACTAAPSTPGSIYGQTSICASSTGNTYVVPFITNASSYTWSVPAAVGTVSSGQGTNTVTITGAAAAGTGTMSVTATNACGTSSTSTVSVSVKSAPSAFTITQTSSSPVCTGTAVTFSVAAVANTTYAWSVTPATCGTASGSTTGNTFSVTPGTGAAGTVTCVETNYCGSTTATLALNTTFSHGSKTFAYTGTLQTWTVPSCVTLITIKAEGAAGGASDLAGGDGAITPNETFTVVSGDVLDIVVGGEGASAGGGSGGGGGGGGASIVWDNAIILTQDYPLIVAGGGGGGGGSGAAGLNASGASLTATSSANTGSANTGGTAGSVGANGYEGGGGAGWFTGWGGPEEDNTGGGGCGPQYSCSGGIPASYYTGSGNSIIAGNGGYGGGGGGGASTHAARYGGGGGGGGFNGGPGGSGTDATAGEYGGGGGSSGYYKTSLGGFPYNTAADFVATTGGTATNTGNGSVTITW